MARRTSGAGLDELLEEDEGEEQAADRDLRVPGAERPLEVDRGLDDRVDEHADQRAEEVADAARQQRPTDHDGGDRVELEPAAARRVAGLHPDGRYDPRE